MNLVINEISLLSELVEMVNKRGIEFMNMSFYSVYSALPSFQQPTAIELEQDGVLNLVELDYTEYETSWLFEHMTSDIAFSDLSQLRYALLYEYSLLTNDPVLTKRAQELGIKVVDVSYLVDEMEDNIRSDEKETSTFLANVFKHNKGHWQWFKSQHLHFGRVAALL